ncbi:YihY/virulence factor BrkB family protein [Nocardioides sp. cx-173]|uniref:YihY/virulence factor BrkB family protein n=1 Tax=Nocardioides sp. cx-173 TaxID=2898796 RepID=UPI001E2B026D|nr:YihY/virulence factor BrkB family protein [Nocardioides sp. cx-173]MCD4523875.1 YihY/virulence factor BrkB family protein [Nocardioides sp. cx-173]UGB41806.1 YihY/virulence factor BrkB family protein [Nocardioides sp. cx-173]
MGNVVGRVDRTQRRFRVLGVPIAVVYKFFDDQGNYLSAALTYYAFVAIFPILLLATSIFGFFLQGDPELQEQVLNSALSNFPIIGDQLGRPEGLRGSTGAVVVGALAAMYGCLGLGMAAQNTMATAYAVPRNSRPNPFLLRFRSLTLLASAGVAVLVLSGFGVAGSNAENFGAEINTTIRWLILGATVVVVGLVLTLLFRMASPRRDRLTRAAPGAFFVALGWQGLQQLGTVYATNVLAGTSSMNQTFGLVLGLIGLIYIAAVIGVLGVELNVVLAQRLWPRALLTPFTDAVDLTEADRRVYAMYAQMQRHKGFETIIVRFDGRDGDTHEIVLDGHEKDGRSARTQSIRLDDEAGAEGGQGAGREP